jgi:signal transduction histidine kinase
MIASAGLAVALAGAAFLLFNTLRVSLTRGLDDSARQGAQEVVALVDANRLPDPVPVPGTITVQVLDARGRITDASPYADRLIPLLTPAEAVASASSGRAHLQAGGPYGMPSLLRVVAVDAKDHQTVLAAVSYAQVSDSLNAVAEALAIGTPLLFGVIVAVTWLVVGYTLRPIDQLRRGAEEITGTAVPRDLPVPEARDEVHSLAVTLNDMLARLATAQQRQRDLVSDTAHELRNPLASIRTQLEVALDHPDRQDWDSTARDVLADTLRLSRLAEDLLVLARLDERASAGGVRARATVDVGELCREVAGRYRLVRVPVTASAAVPCLVAGDRDGLDRMLVNLLDNAIRYARSAVTVSASSEGGRVTVAVADDGPGIPAIYAERAFGRFSRLDDARSRSGEDAGGAGLGLAIVRATAGAHGGSARLEDARPGLRAVVDLPAAPDVLPAAEAAITQVPGPHTTA